jgi:hypothetical protein
MHFWLLPVILELLCRSLLREQLLEIMISGGVESWGELYNLGQFEGGELVALVTLEGMDLLLSSSLFSKMRPSMGSASSRYTALLLSAWVQSSWDPLIGCLQPFWMLGCLMLGPQLPSSMNPIMFNPRIAI